MSHDIIFYIVAN